MRKLLYLLLVSVGITLLTAQINNGGGGGGSGTVNANNGSAGAVANYAAAGGSTTVGPDATLTDNGTALTYTGTGGIASTGATSFTAGTSATTAGCYFAFGTSGASTKICAVGNGTEWDSTFSVLHLPAGGTYGVASGNATFTSASTTILQSGSGSWTITASGANLAANTGKGQHINSQAANNDLFGTASGTTTTATVTFTTSYTSTPSCVITPTTAGVTSAIITSQANTGFTITYAPSGSTSFNYHCGGNPN